MSCPYLNEDEKGMCCKASLTGLKPSLEVRVDNCLTEDYDFCALFLAHILRHGSRRPNIRVAIAV